MALPSVDEIVKQKLAFVPAAAWVSKILFYKNEQQYYLNTYLLISPTDDPAVIEDETNWQGMKRLLLAEITAYQLLLHEVVETTGGTETSKPGSGSKLIKKGKADVVEAEFEYAKSEDGRTIAMKVKDLLPELKANICRFSQALDIVLPGYCPKEKTTLPPFEIVEFGIDGKITGL